MANSLQVTVTAPIGPGDASTAVVFQNCRAVHFNGANGVIQVEDQTGKSFFYDANTVQTVTATAAAGVWTFTIST